MVWENDTLMSHVSHGYLGFVRPNALWCRPLSVSAASISSADIPESTLAALVERSSDLLMSVSIEARLWVSVEERYADKGGEKGGGTA